MKHYSLSNQLHSEADFKLPKYSDTHILNCMLDFQKLAEYQIKLAQMMRDHNQWLNCLILCDRAMFSMAKAIYVHRNQIIPLSTSLSMNDLLRLIRSDAEPCLDVVLFMGTVHYLVSGEEEASRETMKLEEVDMLLYKTDSILERLSRRIVANPSKRYPSIFKENPFN
ncbi:hypothetical protein G9G63_06770 [Paenibacillus sp. EKM202P]|uniref:hypothetical protein n=1 Tax=unclassified Paenibacillus TaxID=185978 RepID=UPI0013EE2A25|nr:MULTISPECIES: hypothetical protein [unclassified Paenibacillus]KAF6565865.1 hypothetical protein G9G63_06770 [Paenibacillus sp. EKM202P]KAF6572561.1 hypothetical protein G9G64_02700 [Paenibacillus sp. EKM207P]